MSFSQTSSTEGDLLSLEAMMELYSSNPNAALASVVPLLDSSPGNIAVVHPLCDRVLVVRKSALALEVQEFRRLLKPGHPEYFFLSLRYHTTHGPVTPASHPREIKGIFIQCVGQLICVPPCQECRNAPQTSTNRNSLFFNLCVTASDEDNGVMRLCGSCFVQPDPKQTCTPTRIPSGTACAAYHLPYNFSTRRAFQYLPDSGASGQIGYRVLENWHE